MHRWKHERPDGVRYGASFDLPTALPCWLFGHRARVEVREPTFSNPWVLIECRHCGLRYANPTAKQISITQAEAEEMQARQVEHARRDPDGLARSCSGRDGYGHRHVVLNLDIGPRRYWSPGFEVKLGNRSSETPIDVVVHGPRRSYWLGIEGVGELTAHRITRGGHKKIRLGGRYIERKVA
jgi:hypothetical protein